ncbi:ExbD/TolR family protein [Ghiorsea bivora]|uniref:ExbD/TolR family protein n=1 Tax=Ghiorsea bivora TaxID=1485545 RepID=UPI0005706E5B|nr:biopolymer transporter ExbD [Ghiorsea bivora]
MNLRPRQKRSDLIVDLTPMIDVVFLMLIFFMVSTSFTANNSIKLDLPQSKAQAANKEEKQVVISIKADGQLYVQDERVKDADLRRRILNITKGDPNMRVVIRADADARHKRLVYALDTIRELGMGKVGIATVPLGGK